MTSKTTGNNLEFDPSRRKAFALGAGLVASILLPGKLALASDFWSQPRSLWLQRRTPRGLEEYRGVFFSDGKLLWDEYVKICVLMRDVRADEAVQMSPVLLDVLCGVQGVFSAAGYTDRPLVTTSGYRNTRTNGNTEGAAKGSLHMEGRAWDGRIPEATTQTLGDVAKYLQGGGVGVYVQRGFCHLDDGRLRTWRGA